MCQTGVTETICYCDEKNAKLFVENLMNCGVKIRCDDTNENFRKNMNIPDFYDKEKFRRGQTFFHHHIFAMFYAKLLGLIADLSLLSAHKILKYTNESSEPVTAYRRYVSTIFSMYSWYSYELTPGSKSWHSLSRLRNIHNSASKKCFRNNVGEISQAQMALAQFGFMGFVVVKPEEIGIFNASEEDIEAFTHFWRVMGHMLGMEERFNICRESLIETKQICNQLLDEIINPAVQQWDSTFLEMATALIQGMWAMMPVLNTNVWLSIVRDITIGKNKPRIPNVMKLNFFEKCLHIFINFAIFILRYDVIRNIQRHTIHCMLFLTQRFPFLAYYKYGLKYRHTELVESAQIDTLFN